MAVGQLKAGQIMCTFKYLKVILNNKCILELKRNGQHSFGCTR